MFRMFRKREKNDKKAEELSRRISANGDDEEFVRKHIVFIGDVQGVGFRYRALHAANSLGLTGWVKNDPDDFDRVEMEIQGDVQSISKVIYMIRQGTYVDIRDMRVTDLPVEWDERSFKVVGY